LCPRGILFASTIEYGSKDLLIEVIDGIKEKCDGSGIVLL
jgi:hypothetical protein